MSTKAAHMHFLLLLSFDTNVARDCKGKGRGKGIFQIDRLSSRPSLFHSFHVNASFGRGPNWLSGESSVIMMARDNSVNGAKW